MRIKNIITKTLILSAVTMSCSTIEGKESAAVRLERGVNLMGDSKQLEKAILEFEAVLLSEEKSKKIGAEARYRLMECYLKLNEPDKAKKQLKVLHKNYTNENPWAIKGGELLPNGIEFSPVPWTDGELSIYDVKLPNGTIIGQYYSVIKASEENGEKTWTGHFTRTSGSLSQSSVEFSKNPDFSLIRSRGYMQGVGDFEMNFNNNKSWEVKDVSSNVITANGDLKSGDALFDNDQSIHLLRLLPNEIGDKTLLPIVAVLMGGMQLDFELEAVDTEKIETELGEFDCVKYKSNIYQDFWVQKDGHRYLVKMKVPGANLELKEVRSGWSYDEPVTLTSKKNNGKINAPSGTFEIPVVDNKSVFRNHLTDPKLRFQLGTIEMQNTDNFLETVRGKNRETIELLFKNMSNKESKVEVYEKRWLELSREDEMNASIGVCKFTQGELVSERLILCAHGEKKTLTITFDCSLGKSEEIIKLARDMFKSWKN